MASFVSVFWGISALPVPVHHPRGFACRAVQPDAAAETSVATDDVSSDAGPHLTPVTFSAKGTR